MSFVNTIATLGIASIVAALIYIGKKLQVLDDLQITTGKIKTNLKIVSDYLTISRSDFNHKELEAYSPLKMTPAGEKLVKGLGFDEVFNKQQADFFHYIDGEEPKLRYDVENAAIRSIAALSDQKYMEFLKVFL